jgi:membrane-associated protein
MDFNLIDIVLHVDKYLDQILLSMGVWTYVILFLVIFAETGLVVTPFLPGDSLLFAIGAVCARPESGLNLIVIIASLIVAAILGDALNYTIGRKFGERILASKLSRFIKREHLDKTHQFYEKHGGKTIIFARFMPIVRTFAPFVAGIGTMTYSKFAMFNIVGGMVWISSFTLLGFFFGELPIVKKNFTLVIIGIIILSILPAVVEILRAKLGKANNQTSA